MNILQSIRKREKKQNVINYLMTFVAIVAVVGAFVYGYFKDEMYQKNVYILESNSVLAKAKRVDINNSQDLIMKAEIKDLINNIYQHVANSEEMNRRIKVATEKGDQSIANMIIALKNHNYYNQILEQKLYSIVSDNPTITIDYSIKPYTFTYKNLVEVYSSINSKLQSKNQIIIQGNIAYNGTNSVTKENIRGCYITNARIIQDQSVPLESDVDEIDKNLNTNNENGEPIEENEAGSQTNMNNKKLNNE